MNVARGPAYALCIAVLVRGATARAQNVDSSVATELFRQGREALEAKNYAVACAKLGESLRLDPHVGTLISLAECEEGLGHLASARGHWQHAIDLAHGTGDGRGAFAASRFASLDPRVPRLTLRRGSKSADSLVVLRDGVEVGGASFDTPLPVEPGNHTLVARATGFAPSRVTVTLAEGDSKELLIEVGPALALEPTPTADAPHPPTNTATDGSVQRPVAVGFAGGGVVAAAIGVGFGIAAFGGTGAPAGVCNPGCDAAANARVSARTDGDVATGAFIAAGAFLATGATLWFTAPARKSSGTVSLSLAPAPHLLGLSLSGTLE